MPVIMPPNYQLGQFEQIVLLSILRLGKPHVAFAFGQQLEEHTGQTVTQARYIYDTRTPGRQRA